MNVLIQIIIQESTSLVGYYGVYRKESDAKVHYLGANDEWIPCKYGIQGIGLNSPFIGHGAAFNALKSAPNPFLALPD